MAIRLYYLGTAWACMGLPTKVRDQTHPRTHEAKERARGWERTGEWKFKCLERQGHPQSLAGFLNHDCADDMQNIAEHCFCKHKWPTMTYSTATNINEPDANT